MTYATALNVIDEIDGFKLSASSPVVDEDTINRFIDEEDAVINLKIAHAYVTAIVETESPLSFMFLKRIETWLVAWRVVDIMDKTSTILFDDKKSDIRRMIAKKKQAEDELRRIVGGTIYLADAVSKASRISGNANSG